MEFVRLFFSFHGRLGRTVYLVGFLVNLIFLLIVFLVVDTLSMILFGAQSKEFMLWLPLSIALLMVAVSLLSLHVRRVHDRELNGLWGVLAFAVIVLISIAGGYVSRHNPLFSFSMLPFTLPAFSMLAFIFFHLGCIRGSIGPNKFGPDPRNEERVAAG